MSSFILKLIAITAMLIDHLGYTIYHDISWMNYIGRLAFPIFAWQVAIGYQKTKDINLYMYRMLIFALISQPFYILYMHSLGVNIYNININVIFTLLLGLISIRIFDKNKYLGILVIIVFCILTEYFKFEYGLYGILMILIFYIFRNNKYLLILMQVINLIVYCIRKVNYIQLCSLIPIILVVFLHNGKKGKNAKYLFYIFYPLQFLLLFLINIYMLK